MYSSLSLFVYSLAGKLLDRVLVLVYRLTTLFVQHGIIIGGILTKNLPPAKNVLTTTVFSKNESHGDADEDTNRRQ